MSHHSGYTLDTLLDTLDSHGFAIVAGKRRPAAFDIWVLATKGAMDEAAVKELAGRVLPG
jgi:hypothetical protein